MKSKTRLDSAVFQLTPTRTRCDLYIIANDKKEKIASGLLNPFIAHLKAAQDQIAEGGYSVLLVPEAGSSNAAWFTKGTVESFVRFVSTPEVLERVYTIESEIRQIEEAISIQGNNDIQVEDRLVKPVAINEGNKSAYDADTEKAIVLYKPGAQETTGSSDKEGNSKVQLLNVLETRKTVLKKEQGMAFARAVAAGFEIDHVANLLSFAECFGASRLMNACLRFMDLWKQKHESGQWVDIEAEDAMSGKLDYSTMNASGIVLSSITNGPNEPGGDATSETKETAGSDLNAGGEQQYHRGQFPHPGFPPWGMHTSPGSIPVYQAYPMPYYQHYPGTAPFYPPPPYPSMEDPHFQMRQSMEHNNKYTSPEPEDGPELHKDTGKSGKSKSGKVVIRNINFINSKNQNSSGDESESASDNETGDETESRNKRSVRSPKRKGNRKESETRNRKETDSGPWDAFQIYLLKEAAEGDRSANEDIFAMEKDPNTNRRQKTMAADPLAHAERDDDGEGNIIDMQSFDRNGRKILYRSGNDDFLLGRREQAYVRDPLVDNGFEHATANLDRNGLHAADEAAMVSLRSTSGVNDNRSSMNMDYYDLPSSNSQNPEDKSNKQVITYEPDALSLMPERDLEKRHMGYDPALDYELQLAEDAAVAASREKKNKTEVKKGSKSAEKHQQSKANQGAGPLLVRKGRPSKVNNTLEDARARAEKLRSYKADLQKMKKQQQDAELKRLEALKMERQKRIAARANSSRRQLPSKLSPMSHRGSKFTDSEPGSSSPLQRSKIRPTSIGSTNSKKPSTSSTKLADGNHSAGNRLTRSLSSMSNTKKEISSVIPDSKASTTRIRRLSEPKKINNIHIHATIKTRSAEPVSKPKLSNGPETKITTIKTRSAEPVSKPKLSSGSETKKISAIINLDQTKTASLPELKIRTSKASTNLKVKEEKPVTTSQIAKVNLNDRFNEADDNPIIDKTASLPELKIRTSKASSNLKVKEEKPVTTSQIAKVNLNDRFNDADDNPIIDKTVVMLEHKRQSSLAKEFVGNHGTGVNVQEVPLSMEIVDKGTISVHPQKHPTSSEVNDTVEDLGENPGTSSGYQAPYARVSSFEDPSTRNSEYAKAPPSNFGMASGAEKAYVSDFNNLKLEKIPEVLEKPQPKGFRRLLMLGKKSHTPSDAATSQPDNITFTAPASAEVHTLKTLISEDGHASQKSSRHFSLLSSFRGKTTEKKPTA